MAVEVERFIRVENYVKPRGAAHARWHTLPNAMRVRVWHMVVADALSEEVAVDESPKRFIFHINYIDGVAKGCRVNYLGQTFGVLSVADSTRLRGLELQCAPQLETAAPAGV